jgi:hypothetical protein
MENLLQEIIIAFSNHRQWLHGEYSLKEGEKPLYSFTDRGTTSYKIYRDKSGGLVVQQLGSIHHPFYFFI